MATTPAEIARVRAVFRAFHAREARKRRAPRPGPARTRPDRTRAIGLCLGSAGLALAALLVAQALGSRPADAAAGKVLVQLACTAEIAPEALRLVPGAEVQLAGHLDGLQRYVPRVGGKEERIEFLLWVEGQPGRVYVVQGLGRDLEGIGLDDGTPATPIRVELTGVVRSFTGPPVRLPSGQHARHYIELAGIWLPGR